MDLDFKDRTFSFLKLRKKRIRRRITFISVVFVTIIVLLFFKDRSALSAIRKAEDSLLRGRIDESSRILNKLGNPFFRRSEFKELRGVLKLITNNIELGEKLLSEISPGNSALRSNLILSYLSDNCEYQALDIYSSHLPENDTVRFFRIVSDTSLYRAEESERKIKNFKRKKDKKFSEQLSIIKKINNQIKSGEIEFIFDRNGKAIASFDITSNKIRALIPGIFFNDFEIDIKKGLKFTRLSIDSEIHQKLDNIFKGNFGTFILVDHEDGGIIATYSKPYDKTDLNTALYETYEPGSVIKLITMFSYLKSKKGNIFPFFCKGFTVYDNKIFYDWKKHGNLDSPMSALARSCNIAFAEMGIVTGERNIHETLKNFMFNSEPVTDYNFKFGFGNFRKGESGKRAIANLSIGLENISVSTFHSAVISSIFAQGGNIISPYLVMSKRNLFDLAFYNHSPVYKKIYQGSRFFEDIKLAMRKVTTDNKGTGRRARVDFMEIGIKTGTSGNKKIGLDSVITGFFPYEKPRYSFAFRLEHGGKAEFKGALFLKKFLKVFYGK